MSITAKKITSRLEQSILAGGWNRIKPEDAIREELAGMPIYDAPIFGFGAAHDPLFHTWKSPQVMHPDVLPPQDWLPGPGHRQGKCGKCQVDVPCEEGIPGRQKSVDNHSISAFTNTT